MANTKYSGPIISFIPYTEGKVKEEIAESQAHLS